MTVFVAFLRAVNVGGTGRLLMHDLRRMCNELGFADVQTYIASGNLVFGSDESKESIKTALEGKLRDYVGKDVGVVVRTASELCAILNKNPFPERDPKFTVAIFLDRKPPNNALAQATGRNDEDMRIGAREIYVYYGSGLGRSKLRIPAAKNGTARNMNTVRKMVELSSK
jgi:uncharacterized protein (DUF1697 family)